jgi:hypothetical protein
MSALGQRQTFALQQSHVRFTPESGHWRCTNQCPLSLLRLCEVGAFPPSGEAIETLIGLASLSQLARMFIHAV